MVFRGFDGRAQTRGAAANDDDVMSENIHRQTPSLIPDRRFEPEEPPSSGGREAPTRKRPGVLTDVLPILKMIAGSTQGTVPGVRRTPRLPRRAGGGMDAGSVVARVQALATAGSCWVRQWTAPRPKTRFWLGIGTIGRSWITVSRIASASRSAATPKTGTRMAWFEK